MGKLAKIQRSKKHKKIKAVDPFYEGERKRNLSSQDVNRCPKNLEEQEIPRSVQSIMKLQGLPRKQKRKKKEKQNLDNVGERLERGMTRPLRPVPEFKQKTGESKYAFMMRVDQETQAVIHKSKLEDQYAEMTGQGSEVDEEESQEKQKKKSKKKEKQKLKKAAKVEKDREFKEERRKNDFGHLQDRVEFGEVAMAPPRITAKPRKGQPIENKPGKKSLLLNEIIRSNLNQRHDHVTKRQIGKSEKRKNLSMAKQQVMDAERSKVIDLYRQLKAQKQKSSNR